MKEALDALVFEMVEKGIRLDEAMVEIEGRFIRRVMERQKGNRSLAAQTLGMHRNTLARKQKAMQPWPRLRML
ncbi:MAG: helix-turn-helix domain-containing protein [Terriglobales bacterium]